MKFMKKYRKMNSIISSFLLAICFCILQVLIGTYIGALNEDVILQKLQESNYYEDSYSQFVGGLQEQLAGSTITVDDVQEVLSFQQFYIDERTVIMDTLQGQNYSLNIKEKHEAIVKAVSAIYEQQGKVLTINISEQINQACDQMMKLYEETMECKLFSMITDYRREINRLSAITIPIVSLILITLILSIWSMYRHKHKALRFMAYAALSASMMNIVLIQIVSHTYDYSRVLTGPEYYQSFVKAYLQKIQSMYYYPAMIGAAVFIVLVLIIQKKRSQLTRGE